MNTTETLSDKDQQTGLSKLHQARNNYYRAIDHAVITKADFVRAQAINDEAVRVMELTYSVYIAAAKNLD